MADYKRIGEILLAKGKISPAQLQTAIEARRLSHQRIGQLLTGLGFVTESEIAEALAEQFDLRVVDPEKMKPTRQALELIDSHQALAHHILPLKYSKDCLECIMADPVDFPTTDMIARLAGKRIVVHVAASSAITNAIIEAYGVTGVTERAKRLSAPKPQRDRDSLLQQLSTLCSVEYGSVLISTSTGGAK